MYTHSKTLEDIENVWISPFFRLSGKPDNKTVDWPRRCQLHYFGDKYSLLALVSDLLNDEINSLKCLFVVTLHFSLTNRPVYNASKLMANLRTVDKERVECVFPPQRARLRLT